MIINHPILGPRDSAEFTYMGDAALLDRPDWQAKDALAQFINYGYLRDNPAGPHQELWYHEQGDRSFLVVTVGWWGEVVQSHVKNDIIYLGGDSRTLVFLR